MGYTQIWGETDSMLLANYAKKEWKPPWRIKKVVEDIQKLVEDHGIPIN